MNDIKIDIESLLYNYYIKYDRLFEMNKSISSQPKDGIIDIYIDIYDMIKKIYNMEIFANKRFSITSAVINVAAHYRGYYRTRHRLWARIFLVYADESSNNHRSFLPTFGIKKEQDSIKYESTTQFIKSQLELVKILAAYIEDVYFIERTSDFTMFTYDNILRNPDAISIVISKSSYAYQIPAMHKNAYLFRPLKSHDGDLSFCIDFSHSLIKYYSKVRSEQVIHRLAKINPQLMSIMMDLNGCSSKHVSGLTNITRATSLIEDAIDHNRIINGYNSDINYLYNNLNGINVLIDESNFENRFRAIDLVYQHMIYSNSIESKDNTWLINLHDANTVRNINNTYFIDNPLDLENL